MYSENIVEKVRNWSLGEISPLLHNIIFNLNENTFFPFFHIKVHVHLMQNLYKAMHFTRFQDITLNKYLI